MRTWWLLLCAGVVGVSAGQTLLAEEARPAAALRYRIDQSQIETREWHEAIRKAQAHQTAFGPGRGYYSLLRISVDDALASEEIQVEAAKVKEFTEKYHGGGGMYRTVASGEFVLIEHIGSDRRKDNRDPLTVGAWAHGQSLLWLEVPPVGGLSVVGDVILQRCPDEEMGLLTVKLTSSRSPQTAHLAIGPVVVGGPYGKTHAFDKTQEFSLRLPPGDYKILLPDFDMKKSRWTISILSRQATKLVFDEDIQLRSSLITPLP